MLRRTNLNGLRVAQVTSLLLVSMVLLLSVLLLTGCAGFFSSTPQAAFTYTPSLLYPYQQVEFDASGSSSEDDRITQYAWDFDDGATGSGKVVEHTFISSGDYAVSLTVTTENGQEATATHVVHVADAIMVPNEFSTIQAAIDAAESGDVVVVLPGTYPENINFLGKAITVQSTDPDDPDVVDATVIEGGVADRPIVMFINHETGASILAGVTLKGGHEYATFSGGGIYVREASPTIRYNNICNNNSYYAGGGIYLGESRALIVGNRITQNDSQSGGGIAVEGYAYFPTITSNAFDNNTAATGGAIYIGSTYPGHEPEDAFPTTIRNNAFIANVATLYGGGAIYVGYDCKLQLDDPDSNTYSSNDPDDIFYVVPPSG